MTDIGIAIHGPMGPTGMGIAINKLAEAIDHLGRSVTVSNQRDGWTSPYYHLIVEQPAFIERAPWVGLVPTFELPLRNDEKKNLILPSPNHRMFCLNEFIQEEAKKVNPDFPEKCFPLTQQGADFEMFTDVTRTKRTVGTIGKFEPRKGYSSFFAAVKELRGIEAYAMATSLLHTSEEITKIQRLCDENGVQLLPWEDSHSSALAFLSSLHVAVFASHAEGWGLGVSESLAQGCIVVASDIHAHRRQYQLLKEGLGEEEASYRLRLVPTRPAPIVGHDRWYPGALYVGKKWLECEPNQLKLTTEKALKDNPCSVIPPKDFPLSWERAAKRLLVEIDKAVDHS